MATHRDWNAALRSHFLAPEARRPVFLALDDDELESVWHESLSREGLVGGAVSDFARAVREDLAIRGWLPTVGEDCVARCCLFVLAHSHVAGRGTPGAPAFWPCVSELLDPQAEYWPGTIGPMGLDQGTFQEIWARARDAFPEIELPEASADNPRRWGGHHCNVRLVQSQAALRQLDLRRIQALLREGHAGRKLRRAENGDAAWDFVFAERSALTPYAQCVLANNPGRARAQVLALWEVTRSATESPRKARRRGESGPPAPRTDASADVYIQLEGLRRLWAYRGDQPLTSPALAIELRRHQLWVFDDLRERYTPATAADAGDGALFFIEERHDEDWLPWLRDLSGDQEPDLLHLGDLEGLPAGWIVARIRSIRRPKESNALASRIFDDLQLQGGLRVGPGRWIFGAGPVAITQGAEPIEVDGSTVDGSDDRVSLKGLAVGQHEICCGGRLRPLEIVPARRQEIPIDGWAWVWPDGAGWPSYESPGQERLPILDGPAFTPKAARESEHVVGALAGPYVVFPLRSRPTLGDVERAFERGGHDVLRFAAIARGTR